MRTALTVCCLLVMTACGAEGGAPSPPSEPAASASAPPSGVDDVTVEQLLAGAEEGLRTAESVRVRGTLPGTEPSTSLDVVLQSGRRAAGVITLNGFALDVVRIGDDLWLRAPREFYGDRVDAPTLDALEGRYSYQSVAGDITVRGFAPFTDLEVLAALAFDPQGEVLVLGEPTQVLGQDVLTIVDDGLGEDFGTLYVSADEPVRPVQLAAFGAASAGPPLGDLDFVDYGADAPIAAPPADEVVDLLQPAG